MIFWEFFLYHPSNIFLYIEIGGEGMLKILENYKNK